MISTTRKAAVALIALTIAAVATSGAASAQPHGGFAEPRATLALLAAQDTQAVAAMTPAASAPTTYVIAPGDTLSKISARFCGTSSRYPNLAAASGIGNFDLIYPGSVVTLDCTATPKAPSKPAPPAPTARVQHVTTVAAPVSTTSATGRGKAAVVAFALAQVGHPYAWGAAGPRAFDCSGLVVAAFLRIGISLPHQSESLLGRGTPVSRVNLQPGDVIWPYHGHVMIYIGNGRVVEAANPKQGVRISDLYAFMAARRF